jgi:hypothetical protein
MDFLAELEVHFRCGVDIRVLESGGVAAHWESITERSGPAQRNLEQR